MQKKILKKKIETKLKPPKVQKKAAKRALKSEKKEARFGLHSLVIPKGAHKRKKLLGRGSGSGHGKTSTRGSKGQTSRAGRHFYLGFEGGQTPLIRRMPKRGFTSQSKKEYQIVNLTGLGRIKEVNITLEILEANGLIKDKNKLVKILGDGEIKGALSVQAHAFSKSASEKIQKAGGKTEIIS